MSEDNTMRADTMTLERFKVLVDAYGAQELSWPEAERAAAVALCGQSSEARAQRAEAAALDAELAKAALAVPDAALEARILATFKSPARSRYSKHKWLSAGAVAACLVMSVVAAWAVLQPSHGHVDLSDPQAWDLIGEDLEFSVSKS
jgi:ferric-dicitrate binding protein FerR (iron transport regulator)